MSFRSMWMLAAGALLWPLSAVAVNSFGVSSSPDTKTRFVWAGAKANQNPDRMLYLVVNNSGPNGNNTYGNNVYDEIDLTYAKSEVGQIKWCSYVGTELDSSKCKPDKSLKPGGTITVP